MSADADPRPRVARPRDVVPLPLAGAVALVLALGLFATLEARRTAAARDDGDARVVELAPVPELAIPAAPPPPQIVIHPAAAAPALPAPVPRPFALPPPSFTPPPMPAMPEARPAAAVASRDPALVVDLTSGNGAAAGDATATPAAADEPAHATLIRNRDTIIAEGTTIAAILETPLDSDHPGLARALVAADVRGFDGSRVLIPRGSRLVGSFHAESGAGVRRVLVTWERLIRPDGVAIRVASPATDALGGAGIPGSVDSHFAARFASAVLQSALMVGVNVASEVASSGSGVFIGLPAQAGTLGQQLGPATSRAATVRVKGGTRIAVLVARDLDFGGTPAVR